MRASRVPARKAAPPTKLLVRLWPAPPLTASKILSVEEVARVIDAAASLSHRTMLMVLYSTGMRNAELRQLQVADIDSRRMLIHIRRGKGCRDRFVPLSPTHDDIEQFAQLLADTIGAATLPLHERISTLERANAELRSALDLQRAHPRLTFHGVHVEGRCYATGSAVIRRGSLWVALQATSATPGGDDPAAREWQRAVKAGSLR